MVEEVKLKQLVSLESYVTDLKNKVKNGKINWDTAFQLLSGYSKSMIEWASKDLLDTQQCPKCKGHIANSGYDWYCEKCDWRSSKQ